MPYARTARTLALFAALSAPAAHAQQFDFDLSQLDPVAVASLGGDLVRRAPDPAIDALFQAVHQSTRTPADAATLCALFEPGADRDPAALQRAAARLGPESQRRFTDALVGIAMAGLDGQPRPFDAVAAQQAVKAVAVKTGFLHDGFGAALAANGSDAASRDARCTAFRQLVGVLGNEPLATRALVTRWLLDQGLSLVARAG